MFSNIEMLVWGAALFVLVVLPIALRWWYRLRLLQYLRQQRPDSYRRLSQTDEIDYDTKTALWWAKDWSYYLESGHDNDDPFIQRLKYRILFLRKFFRISFVVLIAIGALFFVLTLVIPLLLILLRSL